MAVGGVERFTSSACGASADVAGQCGREGAERVAATGDEHDACGVEQAAGQQCANHGMIALGG